jgi:hypothetical protein
MQIFATRSAFTSVIASRRVPSISNTVVFTRLLSSNASGSAVSAEDLVKRLKNGHPANNISETILSKVGKNLHLTKNHPLNIIKTK